MCQIQVTDSSANSLRSNCRMNIQKCTSSIWNCYRCKPLIVLANGATFYKLQVTFYLWCIFARLSNPFQKSFLNTLGSFINTYSIYIWIQHMYIHFYRKMKLFWSFMCLDKKICRCVPLERFGNTLRTSGCRFGKTREIWMPVDIYHILYTRWYQVVHKCQGALVRSWSGIEIFIAKL